MTQEYGRRHILKAGSSLLAAPMLAGLAGGDALARASKPPVKGAFAPLDSLLQQAIADKTVANVVAMAATEQGIVYEGAFGPRTEDGPTPTSLDTVFWLLSMTKAVTAVACMQLVEQGKLHLDQPMKTILPELESPKILDGFDASGAAKLRPAERQITLRHLLSHTSGFTYSTWSENLERYEKLTGMPDIGSSMNAAFTAPLEFEPGERWEYGIGMDWVGKIVEAVSDQSLEVYFREKIFAPLGMSDSGFLIGSAQKSRVATMYHRQPDGALAASPFEMSQRPEFFSGGAGLFSTPRDYMSFLQMLLHGGTFHGAQILKPETVRMMMVNQIGDLQVTKLKSADPAWSNDFDLFPGIGQKFGLSYDINTAQGANGRSPGSITWAGLANCYFWLDPVKKVVGTIFTQVLPFYDPGVVTLYAGFEKGLYAGLERA
jgi:methyl acetate hydrolase